MNHHRAVPIVASALTGLAWALIPLSTASASSQALQHATGSHPGSALCKDLKAEQAGAALVGTAITEALQASNFPQAKSELITAFNKDLKTAGPALTQLKKSPTKVQKALKGLIAFVHTIKSDIANATTKAGLGTTFTALGTNHQLEADSTTLTNYVTAQCGAMPTT